MLTNIHSWSSPLLSGYTADYTHMPTPGNGVGYVGSPRLGYFQASLKNLLHSPLPSLLSPCTDANNSVVDSAGDNGAGQ